MTGELYIGFGCEQNMRTEPRSVENIICCEQELNLLR